MLTGKGQKSDYDRTFRVRGRQVPARYLNKVNRRNKKPEAQGSDAVIDSRLKNARGISDPG